MQPQVSKKLRTPIAPLSSRNSFFYEFSQFQFIFANPLNSKFRHFLGSCGAEMSIVLNTVRKVRVLTRFELKKQGFRSLHTISYYHGLAFAVHVDERHFLLPGNC